MRTQFQILNGHPHVRGGRPLFGFSWVLTLTLAQPRSRARRARLPIGVLPLINEHLIMMRGKGIIRAKGRRKKVRAG